MNCDCPGESLARRPGRRGEKRRLAAKAAGLRRSPRASRRHGAGDGDSDSDMITEQPTIWQQSIKISAELSPPCPPRPPAGRLLLESLWTRR